MESLANHQDITNTTLSAWPPSNGLSTNIVSRSDTILPIFARTTIAAPAPIIWSILRDTALYTSWNTFCPSVTIHEQPKDVPESEAHLLHLNTSFTFHVVMNAAKPNKVTLAQQRITDISTPEEMSNYVSRDMLSGDGSYHADLGRTYRIAWTTEGGFVARGLKTERFHEIIPLVKGGGCEVKTWECQGGVLARAVKFYYKDVLPKKFSEWCADLKREAERRVNDGSVVAV